MRFKRFKHLEKKVKKADFSESYFWIDNILYYLSFFGNAASIFLASFFLSKLLTDSIIDFHNPIFIWSVTILLLTSLEALKRTLFHKFSAEFLRYKNIFIKEVFLLSLFSVLVVSLSFYSSLRGAREFSSINERIETSFKNTSNQYKDSIDNIYNNKIAIIEKRNNTLFDKNSYYDKRTDRIDQLMADAKTNSERNIYRRELNNIRKDRDLNIKLSSDNDKKIKELKAENDTLVNMYINSGKTDIGKEIDKNKSNSLMFVLISTLIELVILVGIFFNKAYEFISYNQFRELIIAKQPYKKWLLYNELLDIVYINKKMELMPTSDIMESCDISGINIKERDLNMFINLLKQLKVVSDSKLLVKKTETEKRIKEYFKIV